MKPPMPVRQTSATGNWLIIGAALLWGTTGTAQAFAPAGFDSAFIGASRLLIGGVALLILAIKRNELGMFRSWRIAPVLLAGALIAGYQVIFLTALARTGVAVGTVVGIGSSPIAGGLLGFIFRGERPRKQWFAATALAIVGCTLLSLGGGGRGVSVDPAGILLALAAGAVYAAYAVVIKEMMEKHSPNAVLAVVICVGGVMLAPALSRVNLPWLMQTRSLAVLLHLGLISMGMAYLLFARGLQLVPVGEAVTLSLAEPMIAALLGIVVLKEPMNAQALGGILLIFAGLAALTFSPDVRKCETAP
jgi:DME family drug/metabolite transporter